MKRIKFMILMLLLTVFILGCVKPFIPPTLEDADQFLKNNRHDIDVAVNYLKSIDTEDNSVYIKGITISYEFEDHIVSDEEIKRSLQHLWNAGCELICIQKEKNTISFEIWSRTMGDVSCGISCTIDGQGYPRAEFQTVCTPISDGWFYYYADYEEYRTQDKSSCSALEQKI